MPPQPGVFALSYASSSKSRAQNGIVDNGDYHPSNLGAGPSRVHGRSSIFLKPRQSRGVRELTLGFSGTIVGGTPVDESHKRKRKEFASKLGKEMSERREE